MVEIYAAVEHACGLMGQLPPLWLAEGRFRTYTEPPLGHWETQHCALWGSTLSRDDLPIARCRRFLRYDHSRNGGGNGELRNFGGVTP